MPYAATATKIDNGNGPGLGCSTPHHRKVRPNSRLIGAKAVQGRAEEKEDLAADEPHEASDQNRLWQTNSLPTYMQHGNIVQFCASWEEGVLRADTQEKLPSATPSLVWLVIRREAQRDSAEEPLLSSYLHASILSHDSFHRSLAFVLSQRLADATLQDTELFELFCSVLERRPEIVEAAVADLRAVHERDPACLSYSHALLHFKGFHAVQAHRVAHDLWERGSRVLALALQSRMSEAFAVDIHPGARFGSGILLDHGTGVVIGETVVIGNNVSILHSVTLGGTGKEEGDRHPKISDNVLIGACARVLGNIRVGRSAQVAAGSLVLRPVPPRTLVAGAPAVEIGTVAGTPALDMDQWVESSRQLLQSNLATDPFATAGAANPSSSQRALRQLQLAAQQAAEEDSNEPSSDCMVDSVTTDREAQRRGWSQQAPPEFSI